MNHLLLRLSIVAVIFPGQRNFCDTFKANVCDKLGLFFGLRQQVYSTVIECGDYKCRLACYSFIPTRNGRNLRYNEIVLKGINSTVDEFVHESKKFKDAIDELLGVARRTIPKAVWQESPLILVGKFSCLLQFAVIFLGEWNFCDSFTANICDFVKLLFGLREKLYSCVIECGNRKCQLACYSFIPSKSGRNLWLYNKFKKRTTARVQEFVHEPEKFKETIDDLLDEAKKKIPKAVWQETPLILVGRPYFQNYMKKYKLQCVKPIMSCHLKATGFLVPQEPMVLLTDRNEGLLDWFTVNMMFGRLRRKQLKTVAVLNLEFISNQVTFVPSEEEQKTEKYKQYIASEGFGTGKQFQIYSRSFPELGIGEIRQKIIKKGTYEGGVYYTECMLPSFEGSWQYNGVTYRVAGRKNRTNPTLKSKVAKETAARVDVEKCESVIRQVIQPLPKVPSLTGREIYALNDYYRNFVMAGQIDRMEDGYMYMEDIYDAVKVTCRQSNFKVDYLCMDSMYIAVLLQDYYGLQPKDKIYLKDTIKNCDVQKTLGIAYLNLIAQVKEGK
ncbi:hypothetical protein RUM44_008230 [Polyplax serrata]|uniref:Uncharacterized protein n=1 Tax=Polyplax serrata TaxID=468196 RepID=A0ABR1B7V7_POLSC